MGRKVLIISGLICTLLGSIGLVLHGPGFGGLLLAMVDPQKSFHIAMDFRYAAAAATLVALGATFLGFASQRDSVRLSLAGKGLVALAGGFVLISAVAIGFSVYTMWSDMREIAAARELPDSMEIREVVSKETLLLRFSFGALAIAQLLCLGAATTLRPTEEKLRGATVAKLSGVTYMMTGWIIAFIFIAIWFQNLQRLPELANLDAGESKILVSIAMVSGGVIIKLGLVGLVLMIQSACLASIGFSAVRR